MGGQRSKVRPVYTDNFLAHSLAGPSQYSGEKKISFLSELPRKFGFPLQARSSSAASVRKQAGRGILTKMF